MEHYYLYRGGMHPKDDGPWMRAAEVEPELDRLQAIIDEQMGERNAAEAEREC